MSLPLTRARRARIEPRASYVAMASLTSYFKTVTATEHLATAFSPREPGQKTVKRPVGRPRKRRAEDEIQPAIAYLSRGLFFSCLVVNSSPRYGSHMAL